MWGNAFPHLELGKYFSTFRDRKIFFQTLTVLGKARGSKVHQLHFPLLLLKILFVYTFINPQGHFIWPESSNNVMICFFHGYLDMGPRTRVTLRQIGRSHCWWSPRSRSFQCCGIRTKPIWYPQWGRPYSGAKLTKFKAEMTEVTTAGQWLWQKQSWWPYRMQQSIINSWT